MCTYDERWLQVRSLHSDLQPPCSFNAWNYDQHFGTRRSYLRIRNVTSNISTRLQQLNDVPFQYFMTNDKTLNIDKSDCLCTRNEKKVEQSQRDLCWNEFEVNYSSILENINVAFVSVPKASIHWLFSKTIQNGV